MDQKAFPCAWTKPLKNLITMSDWHLEWGEEHLGTVEEVHAVRAAGVQALGPEHLGIMGEDVFAVIGRVHPATDKAAGK